MREEALTALAGCELIIHAGDIGSPEVLERLREIAPVRAVRGNNDRGVWARSLPLNDVIEIGTHHVYLLHDIAELDIDPAAASMAAKVAEKSQGRFSTPPCTPISSRSGRRT